MQEIEYISYIHHTILCFCSKRSQIKFYKLLNNENSQQKRAKSIAINDSADIDYKDFMKIHRKYTSEPYSSLTIDTALPASDSLRFRKNLLLSIKLTLTDELKILDDKIKANQAQYDLDKDAAKISALSSKKLDKYEYLTGEDLGYKPGVVEQGKFEYSPLGKVFNKGLDKKDKDEGTLKRLKNIEDKIEKQFKTIENKDRKQLGIKSVINVFSDELSQEAKNIFYMLSNQEKSVNYKKLNFKRDKNNLEFDFRDYNSLKELFKDIYYKKLSIENAESMPDEFNAALFALKNYNPKKNLNIKKKK